MGYNFTTVEKKWQRHWLQNATFRALDPGEAGAMPKAYVLDMFPYPSGAGLHVGHPEGYTATDIVSRYLRMKGFNVLHPMGWDAFGLPAEQYAVKTNTHPSVTTKKNVTRFREQIQSLGLSYDWAREVDTTDPKYYRWSQWIFLQLFNSYFDPIDQKAKPIGHLLNELQNENFVVAPDGEVVINPTQEGLERIAGEFRVERLWHELSVDEQRAVLEGQRLAFADEVAVNWCPALGTVLANEEVVDGKSEVGGFPVERRPMRQWMLRITAYADRLLADLDALQWPESLKEMQRNWIGKSVGADVDFPIAPSDFNVVARQSQQDTDEDRAEDLTITVFTTRPDTLYGATYMVLAPEHPLVDRITPPSHRETIEAYRTVSAAKSERDRQAETKEKSGTFTGAFAINPVNNERIPVWIADYVLMGYGTGAIMAVPAHDERDFAFAMKFGLEIRKVVSSGMGNAPLSSPSTEKEHGRAAHGTLEQAFTAEGAAINSGPLNGLPTAEAKSRMIEILEDKGVGRRMVNYKLRDWLFSRQRYWGEPFPLLHDVATGQVHAVDESHLPVVLPDVADFRPRPVADGSAEVVPPLGRAEEWQHVWGVVQDDFTVKYAPEGIPGARKFRRELNTMPQWAGSCWYYLRYIDPDNAVRFVDPEKERYWMPVDLYVGGVEHAVLHLLYSRFWHKVLFDLGHVSTPEPFARLVNQGLILGETEYHVFEGDGARQVSLSDLRDIDEEATEAGVSMIAFEKSTGRKVKGRRITEEEVEKTADGSRLRSNPAIRIDARSFKMSKSRGNALNPDPFVKDYGADTFRLYEMYMGPLEAQKPWATRDIIGMHRFLNAAWRNLVGDEEANKKAVISTTAIPQPLDRQMHRAIKKVGDDIEGLRFNTAIAELIKLNNEMTGLKEIPRELAENFTLMLAPFAPHLAEEVWERLGHHKSLTRRPWPTFEPGKLVESSLELPVQVNGKLRDKITVPADADEATILAAAEAAEKVRPWVEGKQVKMRKYVPGKLVNIVVAG
jgi:leucyl-tRNA synthetase